ncbi:MAG TPA: hypothetical protein VMB71_06780, partial [Acetobacteraceae bacterium]|nr:hypothetical protein [Acetobacteraceae bacterium]
MRRLTLLTLAGLLAAGPAPAHVRVHMHGVKGPDPCTEPDDRAAFDVMSLKSELTVTALACHQQDKYNEFMRAYHPAVMDADRKVENYFKRVYGRKSQSMHDEYITTLASADEQDGLTNGTAFCGEYSEMFDEVMSLHDASELPDYAHSQALAQPVSFKTCASVPVKAVP